MRVGHPHRTASTNAARFLINIKKLTIYLSVHSFGGPLNVALVVKLVSFEVWSHIHDDGAKSCAALRVYEAQCMYLWPKLLSVCNHEDFDDRNYDLHI